MYKEFNVLKFENLPTHKETNGIQSVSFPRLPTTCHIHPLLPQIVSQGNTHVPPRHIQKTPNQGFWNSELLGCFFSTILTGPVHLTYLFVCIIWLNGTWCALIFHRFIGFTVHHSSSVTLFPWPSPFFYSTVIQSRSGKCLNSSCLFSNCDSFNFMRLLAQLYLLWEMRFNFLRLLQDLKVHTQFPFNVTGCQTPEGCCVHCCGPLDLAKLLTESPCVMTTEVLDIRQLVQSPTKVG